MRSQRQAAWLATLLTIALAALLVSCGGNSTKPTGSGPAKELDSKTIASGATFVHTFSNENTYEYFCTIHGAGTMSGTVTVAGGQPVAADVSITDFAYTPASAMVAPGGTVTWTNNGSPHTVTSK